MDEETTTHASPVQAITEMVRENMRNSLRAAVRHADVGFVKEYVGHGLASAEDIAEVLKTAAANPRRMEVMAYLSEQNMGDVIGALETASKHGNIKAVEHLLADPRMPADSKALQPALAYAASKGHLEVMQRLLAKGALPDSPDGVADLNPAIPMKMAIENGQSEAVALLIDNGVKIESKRGSYLNMAVYERQYAIAQFFIDKGAKINFRDHCDLSFGGNTPMGYAIDNNDTAMARLLLEHKAHFPKCGLSIDKAIMENTDEYNFVNSVGSLPMLELLVEYGANREIAHQVLKNHSKSWERAIRQENNLSQTIGGKHDRKILAPGERIEKAHRIYMQKIREQMEHNQQAPMPQSSLPMTDGAVFAYTDTEHNQGNLPPMQFTPIVAGKIMKQL